MPFASLASLALASCLLQSNVVLSEPPAGSVAATSPATDTLSLSLRALASAEKGTVTLDATDITIEELFAKLQATASLPLRVDWNALSVIGVANDDRLDFHIRDVPPLAALKAIVQAMDADIDRPVVDASAGQLVVTSPNGLAALRELAIYDVADILADPTLIDAIPHPRANDGPAASNPADPADPAEAEHEGETEHADPAQDAPATTEPQAVAAETPLRARADRLVEIISEHIDPEGWIDSGGSRGRMTSEAGRLIVTATPTTHQQLRALLTTLRQQAPASATITCTFATVDAAELDRLLAAHAGGEALSAALRGAASFRLASSPRVATRIGERATFEAKDASDGLGCAVLPAFDRLRRMMTLEVTATVTKGGSTNRAEATLTGSPAGIREVVCLAGSQPAPERWVVLVEVLPIAHAAD